MKLQSKKNATQKNLGRPTRQKKVKKKLQVETTAAVRRDALADDIDRFLKAGNEIQYIPNGVSSQDPQGRGKPLRLSNPQKEAAKQMEAKQAEVKQTEVKEVEEVEAKPAS